MEFNRKFFLTLLFVALLGGAFGYFLFGTGTPPQTIDGNRDQSPEGDQAISDFSLTENRGENEVWRLYATRARKEGKVVNLRFPRVVYQVEGDTRAVITAERGVYRLSNRHLTLRKDVVLNRTNQNQVLKTSILKWNRETGILETSEPVELEMPQGTLTATGMRAQLRKEIIRFLSDVEFSSSSSSQSERP